MKKTDVYVLIRTYLKEQAELETFRSCLESVCAQVFRPWTLFPNYSIQVVISDDCSPLENDLQALVEQMQAQHSKVAFQFLTHPTRLYSASNAYFLKKHIVSSTNIADDAVVILLDQDDQLLPAAITNIVYTMRHADIGLTPYRVKESKNDISRPDKHYEVLKELASGDFTHLYEVETLGWTKVWTKKALRVLVEALEVSLPELTYNMETQDKAESQDEPHRHYSDAEAFFADDNHHAYEDFLDFYVLLRSDLRLAVYQTPTHEYNKTSPSITTAAPQLDDFTHTRVDMLDALLRTYLHMKQQSADAFRNDSDEQVLLYLSYKLYRIDQLLKGYIRQYILFGDQRYKPFADHICVNHLANLLAKRYEDEKKTDPYAQHQLVPNPFILWLNSIPMVNLVSKQDNKQVNTKPNNFHETLWELSAFHAQNDTPKTATNKLTVNKRVKRKSMLIAMIALIIGLTIYVVFITCDDSTSLAYYSILFPAVMALISYLGSQLMKNFTEVSEEKRELLIFQKELNDAIRHLEANCKVLLELSKQMKEICGIALNDKGEIKKNDKGETKEVKHPEKLPTRPALVHFQNLMLPHSSLLFSDIPVRHIKSNDQVEHFARIRINLRNMNNSAQQMMRYAQSPEYDAITMLKLINWEIPRYIGYIVTFSYYQQENKFPQPNIVQDEFTYQQLDNLCNLFVSEHLIANRMRLTQQYLNAYHKDRRLKRNVVIDDYFN